MRKCFAVRTHRSTVNFSRTLRNRFLPHSRSRIFPRFAQIISFHHLKTRFNQGNLTKFLKTLLVVLSLVKAKATVVSIFLSEMLPAALIKASCSLVCCALPFQSRNKKNFSLSILRSSLIHMKNDLCQAMLLPR